MDEKHGIEGLSKAIELAGKNIALGIKIADGGINQGDLIYATEAFNNIKELIEFVASKPELGAEIKDLDIAEGIQLIQKAFEEYKKVKA